MLKSNLFHSVNYTLVHHDFGTSITEIKADTQYIFLLICTVRVDNEAVVLSPSRSISQFPVEWHSSTGNDMDLSKLNNHLNIFLIGNSY